MKKLLGSYLKRIVKLNSVESILPTQVDKDRRTSYVTSYITSYPHT